MKKFISLVFLCALFICSCSDSVDPTGGGSGGGGSGGSGSGSGDKVGNFTIPEGGLSVLEQAQALDPNDTDETIFKKGDYGSQFFRIPAIITTSRGTILAGTDRRYQTTGDVGAGTGENIDVIIRRSEDLGKTWGAPIVVAGVSSSKADAYGDLFFINTHSGDIICGIIHNPGYLGGRPAKTTILKSTDDGKTWTEVFDFMSNDQSLFPGTATGTRGFAASGRGVTITRGDLAQGADKPLVFAYLQNTGNSVPIQAMISKNDGNTWSPLGNMTGVQSVDETKIIDLADGTLMMNHRRGAGTGQRSWSKWNGSSWVHQGIDTEITDPGNNADLVRYELPKFAQSSANGRAVYTPIKGEKYVLMIQANSLPGHFTSGIQNAWFGSRANHYIHMTVNDFKDGNGTSTGKYEYSRQLVNNGEQLRSGYPAITVLPDGTIATLTEETRDGEVSDAYDIVFRRFNLNWLSNGKESVNYMEDAFQNQ